MSTIEITSKWLEQVSDFCNPILVKETRQTLKSRQFVISFMLLLIASWLISVFGMLSAGDAIEYGSTGRAFFGFYYCVLAVAIFVAKQIQCLSVGTLSRNVNLAIERQDPLNRADFVAICCNSIWITRLQ